MTAPSPAQVAADLRAAAGLIEARGWRQGDYVGQNGCRCVDGAIVWATGGDSSRISVPAVNRPRRDAAERALAQHLDLTLMLAAPHFAIQAWNDAADRTVDDVLDALRSAAVVAEGAQ